MQGILQSDLAELAQLVQAAVSTFALLLVIYQMYYLSRGIRGVTQDNLYEHYNQVLNVFFEKPYLRPYFYDRKRYDGPDPAHPGLREEIDAVSEMILGVIEHAMVQRENLHEGSWHSCWWLYARERVDRSIEIRRFFCGHEEYFTVPMRKAIRQLIEELPELAAQLGKLPSGQAAVG